MCTFHWQLATHFATWYSEHPAAAEANEAFKIATNCSEYLNNYMMCNGVTGVYTYTFEYEKKDFCLVCSATEVTYRVDKQIKLEEFMDLLAQDSRLYAM